MEIPSAGEVAPSLPSEPVVAIGEWSLENRVGSLDGSCKEPERGTIAETGPPGIPARVDCCGHVN
jgi:hypothetical protein